MYAIETGGKQYRVREGDILDVEKLNVPDRAELDHVAVADEDGLGRDPFVEGARSRPRLLSMERKENYSIQI